MIIVNTGKLKNFPLRSRGMVIQIPPGTSDHSDDAELSKYVESHPDLSIGSVGDVQKQVQKAVPVEVAEAPKKRKRKQRDEEKESVESAPDVETPEDSDGGSADSNDE